MLVDEETTTTQKLSDAQRVVEARKKRLNIMLLVLGSCVAGLLATLALPWLVITVEPGVMNIDGTTMALQGGNIRVTGLESGVATPLFIGAILGVGAVFAAQKRWWWAIVAAALLLLRTGLTIPLPVSRGAVSLAEGAIGHQLASALWPAFIIMLLLVSLQTALVRQAEKDTSEEPAKSKPAAQKLVRAIAAAVSEAKK